MINLNTNQIKLNTTGKNKAFISRVAKQQEEKYGNVDIFEASISTNEVTMYFGDYSINFYYRDNKVIDTLGNGQGHKYHSNLESCATELYNNFLKGRLI